MSNQRYRIFFSAGMDVGHSFIQIRKSCFFFPRSGKNRKKKHKLVFFFPRKSSSVIHSDFWRTPIVFNKSWLCFFSRILVCFFFLEKFTSHSFIQIFGRKKKTQPGKKKQLFHSFIRNSSKMHKNELFRVKKKYDTFGLGHN